MHTHTHTQILYGRGEQYAQEVGAIFCETSALESTNVEELFVQISEFFTQPCSQTCLSACSIYEKQSPYYFPKCHM